MPHRPAIPKAIKERVLIESGHRCAVCCETSALELAHIVPWSQVREHTHENLLLLCATCHTIADRKPWPPSTFRAYKSEPCVRKHAAAPVQKDRQRTIEVVLPGNLEAFDETAQESLVSALAAFVKAAPGEIVIRKVESGSVRVQLDVPERYADMVAAAVEAHSPALFGLINLAQTIEVVEMFNESGKPLCDLVMKGGITSGVVYPQLIAELADTYRFKNIGGTSAGAIAAAGCAAAEHGRLTGQRADAFAELMKLPGQLKQRSADGHSMLFHLFQPAVPVRKHFAVLVSMLNASPLAAAGRALLAMVRQFWGIALLGVLLAFVLFTPMVLLAAPALSFAAASGVALGVLLLWWLWAAYGLRRLEALKSSPLKGPLLWWGVGLLASAAILLGVARAEGGLALGWAVLAGGIAAPLTIGLVLALSGLRFGTTLVAGMHGNGYGLCSGRTVEAGAAQPGLTDWLSSYFEGLAGHDQPRPLVFGDLWGAPFENGRFADVKPAERRVNLEVMTSAVSQQMCYAIPFRGDQGLYYDPQEWEKLFPARVTEWLGTVSAAESAAARAAGEHVETVVHEDAQGVRRTLSRLPGNANLPLVVAVRMSLSFPALLSAVPLYAVDFSRSHNQRPAGQPPLDTLRATRVWFSDGGIASNMPLHFFDSPLPGHPTFAINLKAEHPDHPIDPALPPGQQPGRVYLPDSNSGGQRRYWSAPADGTALGGLIGFVFSIVDTMQNWRDEIQFPYPGYRDRIVQISQLKDEGGLNLDMPDRNIENLSAAGLVAAQQLRARFHAPPGQMSEGWRNHRRQRLRILLGVFERLAKDLGRSMAAGRWDEALEDIPARDYSAAHKALAVECMRRIDDLSQLLHDDEPSLEERAPKPRASMRIAPRI